MHVGRFGWTPVAVLLVLLTGLEISAGDAAGQVGEDASDVTPADGVVGSFGLGPASKGPGGQMSLWAQRGVHAFGFRMAGTFDAEPFLVPMFIPLLLGVEDSVADFAVLYGLRSGPGKTWGRVGVGPALVRRVRSGDPIDCFFICTYERHRSSTVGLALQADGVLALFGPVGLGASAFGNLNSITSFGGLTVNLVVGQVGS